MFIKQNVIQINCELTAVFLLSVTNFRYHFIFYKNKLRSLIVYSIILCYCVYYKIFSTIHTIKYSGLKQLLSVGQCFKVILLRMIFLYLLVYQIILFLNMYICIIVFIVGSHDLMKSLLIDSIASTKLKQADYDGLSMYVQ